MMSMMFFQAKEVDRTVEQIPYVEETQARQLLKVVAHGYLYLLRSKKVDINSELLTGLLKAHATYFPKQLPVHVQNESNAKQLEYLQIYNQPHDDILEPALMFTLQQLIVDTMVKRPEIYGELFMKGFEPKVLRVEKNLDNPSAIKILAKEILGVNIFVERHNDKYELPTREYFMSEVSPSAELHILDKDNYYSTPSDILDENVEVA